MRKLFSITICILSIFFHSCSNLGTSGEVDPAHLIDVSQYNIDTTALHHKERIEVLCASDRVFPTDELDYYVHTLVVSLETGDTVNVLAVGSIDITENNRISTFISPNDPIAKILQNVNNIKTGTNAKDLEVSKFKKVHRDPEYISIETSHFPSIIGLIGEIDDTNY